jgi:hypothetical protein
MFYILLGAPGASTGGAHTIYTRERLSKTSLAGTDGQAVVRGLWCDHGQKYKLPPYF